MRAEKELNRQRLIRAAETAVGIQLRYAQMGTGLATAAMAGARECQLLRHYPARDVSDRDAGSRFYYHAHPSKRRPVDEHGHFHLFSYGKGEGGKDAVNSTFCHVAGLALDAKGQALRWFTTNRWVTGETWTGADQVADALQRFEVRTHGRVAPVATWLTAMVTLFAPQIAHMVRQRDQFMARHIAKLGREAALDDRSIDVVTECPALLPAQIHKLALY